MLEDTGRWTENSHTHRQLATFRYGVVTE